jgi:tight adherence protein B
MIVLVALALGAMAFMLLRISVAFSREAIAEYRRRYHVETLEQLTDFMLVLDTRQQRWMGLFVGVLFFFIGLAFAPVLAVVLGFAGLATPTLYVARMKSQRIERFEHQLADALQAISGAMRSGLTFRQAMAEVAQNAHAPLGQEFRVFVRELQLGTSLDDALDSLAGRVGSQELDLFVSSSQIAIKVGGNVAEMFDKLSSTLRERFRIEGRIRSLTAQGKLQGVVIGLMPIVVWVGFDFFRPDLTRPMMQSWFGYGVVLIIVLMELLGALFIRRIVEIEI